MLPIRKKYKPDYHVLDALISVEVCSVELVAHEVKVLTVQTDALAGQWAAQNTTTLIL